MTEPRRVLRRAVVLGAAIAAVTGAFVLFLDLAADPDASRKQTDRFPLPVAWTILASVFLGMGLGTQIALLWSNRHRMRAVLRPRAGRVIGWMSLTILAPISHFGGLPIATGFIWPGLIEAAFAGRSFPGSFDEYNSVATVVLLVLYPPLFYVFSCLIISGVRSNVLKIAMFGQVWLAAYGAVLMIFGLYTGNL